MDEQKSKRSTLNNLSQTAQQPTVSIKDQNTFNEIQKSLDDLNNLLNQQQQNQDGQYQSIFSIQN